MRSTGTARTVLVIALVVMVALMAVGVVSGVYWMLLPAVCAIASIVYFMIDLRRRARRR